MVTAKDYLARFTLCVVHTCRGLPCCAIPFADIAKGTMSAPPQVIDCPVNSALLLTGDVTLGYIGSAFATSQSGFSPQHPARRTP